jgi:hypothetical protein
MDTANLAALLKNIDRNDEQPATFIIHYTDRTDTVKNIGIRVKGTTSRSNPKQSYKLGFNSFVKGQKYEGLEKLKLNANWNDPTQLRAHLTTQLYEYLGVVVSRSAFTELYINESYFGLYNIVEHIDEEFTGDRYGSKKGNLYKCLGEADLGYRGNEIHDLVGAMGKPVYELKTNKKERDYSGLIEFIDLLNNTPDEDFACALEQRFNVNGFLKVMAVDILTANWDSYIFMRNNYYLYDNPASGKFEYIPYDFDNAFGIDWVGDDWGKKDIYNWAKHENFIFSPDNIYGLDEEVMEWISMNHQKFMADTVRPLYYRVLAIDKYRNQFNHHLNRLIREKFETGLISREIDRLFFMLTPSLKKDTCDNFTWEQVVASLDGPLDVYRQFGTYRHEYLRYGLKQFIGIARANVSAQIEPAKPVVTVNSTARIEENRTYLTVKAMGVMPVRVTAYISRKDGSFSEISMSDNGRGADKQRGDGVFTTRITRNTPGDSSYYIIAELASGEIVREPCTGYITN